MKNNHDTSYGLAYEEQKQRDEEQSHERSKFWVVLILLVVHYGVIGYTTITAVLLAVDSSLGDLDLTRKILGLLAADLILLASAEGIRHGVFTGGQRFFAKICYTLAFVDVVAAVTAEANLGFRTVYLTQILPISGPVMGAFAFFLAASFLDTVVRNQMRAADLEYSLQEHIDGIKTKFMRLARASIDRKEAGRMNKTYKKKLKGSSKLKHDLMRTAVTHGTHRVNDLLEFSESHSGDGAGEGVEVPDVRPTARRKKAWGRGGR